MVDTACFTCCWCQTLLQELVVGSFASLNGGELVKIKGKTADGCYEVIDSDQKTSVVQRNSLEPKAGNLEKSA